LRHILSHTDVAHHPVGDPHYDRVLGPEELLEARRAVALGRVPRGIKLVPILTNG
jgi:hypothetical protein